MEIQESIAVRVAKRICGYRVIMAMCVCCTFLINSGGNLQASDGIEKGWMTNFYEAEAAAKKAGIPMVVHFWAPWCGPCRNMETEVLTSQDVQAILGNGIIGVKVNSDDHRDLVSRFGVTALPTDVFVSADGKVLSRSVGSPGHQGYLAKLAQFRVANPTPASGQKTQSTAVAQSADPKAETVTAAKPVFEEPNLAEKSIVGLTVANDDAKSTTESKPAPETEPSKVPDALPVAKKKALRKDAGLRIGLSGYSPVALTTATTWQKGDEQFGYSFQGVRYLLSSAEELDSFKAGPEKFIPALHGCDPVSLVKDQVIQSGFVELGATFRSRMYFFSTKASRDEFLKSPETFATAYNLAFFEAEGAPASDKAKSPAEPASTETNPSELPAESKPAENAATAATDSTAKSDEITLQSEEANTSNAADVDRN